MSVCATGEAENILGEKGRRGQDPVKSGAGRQAEFPPQRGGEKK